MSGNHWVNELPVGTKFREVRSADYDYEPFSTIYTRAENTVLAEIDSEKTILEFQLTHFGATEVFEVIDG